MIGKTLSLSGLPARVEKHYSRAEDVRIVLRQELQRQASAELLQRAVRRWKMCTLCRKQLELRACGTYQKIYSRDAKQHFCTHRGATVACSFGGDVAHPTRFSAASFCPVLVLVLVGTTQTTTLATALACGQSHQACKTKTLKSRTSGRNSRFPMAPSRS